ncbi:MAG: hypothetical protein ACTSSP_05630 [Candidatus Asgardarchaeia archaeon]
MNEKVLKTLYLVYKYRVLIILGIVLVLSMLGIVAPTIADEGCPPNPEPISG